MNGRNLFGNLAIGAIIGMLLVKVPWLRWVAVLVAVLFGVVWFMAAFVDGFNVLCLIFALGCFAIAAMCIRSGREPARIAQAVANNYAALQAPEAIARLMQGNAVTQGPAVGYTIQVVNVEPGTIRAVNGEVWADVDLILSNGSAQPATFHASAPADAWEWSARLGSTGNTPTPTTRTSKEAMTRGHLPGQQTGTGYRRRVPRHHRRAHPAHGPVIPVPLKASETIKVIEADRWCLVATRGSHRQYKHKDKPGRVTVAGKPSKELPPGTERSILGQAGITRRSP